MKYSLQWAQTMPPTSLMLLVFGFLYWPSPTNLALASPLNNITNWVIVASTIKKLLMDMCWVRTCPNVTTCSIAMQNTVTHSLYCIYCTVSKFLHCEISQWKSNRTWKQTLGLTIKFLKSSHISQLLLKTLKVFR